MADGIPPRLVSIAPAPGPNVEMQNNFATGVTVKRFNCVSCVRRKIKCDRTAPTCSRCSKSELVCVYQASQPRPKRKRSRSEDVYVRLARYERILQEHNLLPVQEPYREGETSRATTQSGQLLSANGKTRYLDSVLLHAGEGDLCELSDSEPDDHQDDLGANDSTLNGQAAATVVLGAIAGRQQSLISQHPSYEDAIKLWIAYVQNVEPLCKVLHVPTVANMVDIVSKQPALASRDDECLLFVIYYFAVYSMSESQCLQEFGESRARLMPRYRAAFYQALVNASWLRTTSMSVLQAYTLFLIAMRTQLDANTFWILTGMAVRLAMRMGLHRDGEYLGLPPFEVQMRRRLFWQLLPLDGYAGQVSGTGISIAPNSWDTKQPLNINDDQIFPCMTQQPQELKGPSEMIFCLSRIKLSNFYTRTGVKMKEIGATLELKDAGEIERLINEVEDSIERWFLRYCDIVNPLHMLTTGIVRSATNAVRLRARMPLLKQSTTTDTQRRDICSLAEKIIDTNNTIYGNPAIRGFLWQTQAFFLWDSLLCLLRSLSLVGFYSQSKVDDIWDKVAKVYSNHEDFFTNRKTLHITVGKETIKAWDANPQSILFPEPSFISKLRGELDTKVRRQQEHVSGMGTDNPTHGFEFDELFGGVDGTGSNFGSAFDIDFYDWAF
ncbi:hypothetical protein BDW74DRAFT_14782 [Aspergillus multicolor]|uniref:putative C6 transcription factor n=1 Tax=Aspergillus multicolor TaxID=41759 RepID=UPI003CCE039B